ncbi:unnamed protein product, partial [Brachionus calyciflorus]
NSKIKCLLFDCVLKLQERRRKRKKKRKDSLKMATEHNESEEENQYDNDYFEESTSLLRNSTNSQTIEHRENSGISWYFAVFLIVNAALGAGLLNFAKAFHNAGGIYISTIFHLVLLIIIVGALVILAYCTDKKQSANFQDVVYGMCGKKWQTINSFCIILYMFGCCITFFIIIGDQLDQIISCLYGESSLSNWYFNRKFTISLTSILFILPLCYPRRIDFLTYPSTLAVIAIIYVVILIPIKYAKLNTENVHVRTEPEHWMDIFTVLPVICFGYQCHVNAVPIYACLKRKNLSEFSKSIFVSILIVFSAYTITATFGYMTFGDKIDDDLLKSYDSKDVSVLIAIIMYLIKTYTSYPLNLFCARTAIEGLWIEMKQLDSYSVQRFEKFRRVLIVTIWFFLSLFIALFIPNITIVIHYLGALAGTFMFIFPGLCLMFYALNKDNNVVESINNESMSRRKQNLLLLIAIFYITIGTFIIGLVVTQSFLSDINY